MGPIVGSTSYWNSAVSPQQMGCVEWRTLAESAHLAVLESKGLIWGNKERRERERRQRNSQSHYRDRRVYKWRVSKRVSKGGCKRVTDGR